MHTITIRDKYQKMTNFTLAKSGKWSTVEEVEELLDKGLEIMYNDKRSIANKKKALKYFDKALKLDPKNEQVWHGKGSTLHYLQKYKEAITCFDKALKLDPKMIAVLMKKAFTIDAIINSKKKSKYIFKDVIFYYDKALKLDPKNAKAWYFMGHAFKRQDMFSDAINCWFNAMKYDSDKKTFGRDAASEIKEMINSLNEFGEQLIDERNYKDAIVLCDFIQKYNWNKNPQVWNTKGLALMNMGKPKEAITCFDKVLKTTKRMREFHKIKNFAYVHYNKGLAFLDMKKYKESIVCFDKAISLHSGYKKYADIWYDKGLALSYLEKYKESIVCFDKALKIDPKYPSAWYDKATSLQRLKKYKEALACNKKAIKLYPKWSQAMNNMGDGLFYLGKHDEAITCFKKALEYDPKNKSAKHNLFHLEQLLIDFID